MSMNILKAYCTNPGCILLLVYFIIKITILVFCKPYNATTSIKNEEYQQYIFVLGRLFKLKYVILSLHHIVPGVINFVI